MINTSPFYGLWNANSTWSTTAFYCQVRAGDGGDPGSNWDTASCIFFGG
jgi:hypothetical protein